MFIRNHPGSKVTIKNHIKRCERIQKAVANRFRIDYPYGWQKKHMLWFLEEKCKERAATTINDYYSSIVAIAEIMNKWHGWQGYFKNYKKKGIGGRKRLSAFHAKPKNNDKKNNNIIKPKIKHKRRKKNSLRIKPTTSNNK